MAMHIVGFWSFLFLRARADFQIISKHTPMSRSGSGLCLDSSDALALTLIPLTESTSVWTVCSISGKHEHMAPGLWDCVCL